MADRGLLQDIMRRVAWSGRRTPPPDEKESGVVELCHRLMKDLGEASSLGRAQRILDRLDELTPKESLEFFLRVNAEFGVDDDKLRAAIEAWHQGEPDAARSLHFVAEPQSQELIRALNRVPEATSRLVNLRARLIDHLRARPDLKGLDTDFHHLFSSWFNRGFLEIRRVRWSTPADILEKIIEYEAVHEIAGWDDLRQRVGDSDRRLFAFFHPAMPSEPLIFVEVALTQEIPGAIAPILSAERERLDPEEATTAVFYSISNCQKGLRGISFGNFLIKQVVAELQRELPELTTFVTLSPVPGLCEWISKDADSEAPMLGDQERVALSAHDPDPGIVKKAVARYLTGAKRPNGAVRDPVANFHLGNGAILHRVHADADLSARGRAASCGAMVNYLYDGPKIETHHQAYVTAREVAASAEVWALAAD